MISSSRRLGSLGIIGLILLPQVFAIPVVDGQTTQAKEEKKESKRRAREQESLAEPGATSTSRLALPFKRVWQYLTDEASTLAPSIDGARIYLPLAGGKVVCLDLQTGSLLWSTEVGGFVTAPVAVGEDSVFIATRRTADDGSEVGGSLRAVDKSTGLTVWVNDQPRAITSPLAQAGGRLYAGSADGSYSALDSKTGDAIWKIETQDVVRGRALVTPTAICFGSDDGNLRAVEPARGQIIWKYQTSGKVVGQPASDGRSIYFGSGDGYVYSVEIATGKLRWRARTGAAIEASIVIAGDRVLITSFDNFVYALSRSNGDRIWKRRLENRITSAPIVEGDASLIAPLRGDYVAVFLNSDGRRVNLYRLEQDYEIVADPILWNNMLVLATDKGLVVAASSKPADTQTSAVKK